MITITKEELRAFAIDSKPQNINKNTKSKLELTAQKIFNLVKEGETPLLKDKQQKPYKLGLGDRLILDIKNFLSFLGFSIIEEIGDIVRKHFSPESSPEPQSPPTVTAKTSSHKPKRKLPSSNPEKPSAKPQKPQPTIPSSPVLDQSAKMAKTSNPQNFQLRKNLADAVHQVNTHKTTTTTKETRLAENVAFKKWITKQLIIVGAGAASKAWMDKFNDHQKRATLYKITPLNNGYKIEITIEKRDHFTSTHAFLYKKKITGGVTTLKKIVQNITTKEINPKIQQRRVQLGY